MTVQELATMSTGRFSSKKNTSNTKPVTVEELASKSTGRFSPYKTFDFNGYLNKVTSFDTNLTNYYNQNGTKYNFDFDRFDIDAMKKETQTAIGFVNYNKANLQNADELLDYLNNVNTRLNSWGKSFGEMKTARAKVKGETEWNTAVRGDQLSEMSSAELQTELDTVRKDKEGYKYVAEVKKYLSSGQALSRQAFLEAAGKVKEIYNVDVTGSANALMLYSEKIPSQEYHEGTKLREQNLKLIESLEQDIHSRYNYGDIDGLDKIIGEDMRTVSGYLDSAVQKEKEAATDAQYQGIDALNNGVLGVSAEWNSNSYDTYESSNKNEDGTYKTDELYASWRRQAKSSQDVQRGIDAVDLEIKYLEESTQYDDIIVNLHAWLSGKRNYQDINWQTADGTRDYKELALWLKDTTGIDITGIDPTKDYYRKDKEKFDALASQIEPYIDEQHTEEYHNEKREHIEKLQRTKALMITEKESFEVQEEIATVKARPDFAEISKPDDSVTDKVYRMIASEHTLIAPDEADEMIKKDSSSFPVDSEGRIVYSDFVVSESNDNNKYYAMTKDERAVYISYYKEDPKKADEFLKKLEPTLNKRVNEKLQEYNKRYADEHPVKGTLKTWVNVIPNDIMAMVGNTNDFNKIAKGEGIDVNDKYKRGNISTQTIRSVVASNQNYIGRVFYNGLTSGVDNGIRMVFAASVGSVCGLQGAALTKFVSAASSVMMGASVTQSAIIEGIDKGYTDVEAFLYGVAKGGIESLTEKYSIDAILKGGSTIAKTLAKSFIAEGSEEVASNIAGRMLDLIVDGDQAELRRRMDELVKAGYSEAEAFSMIASELIAEDAEAFMTGGFAGMFMGGAGTTINYADSFKQSAKIGTEGAQALIDEGVAIGNELAIETQQKGGNAGMVRRAEILQENKRIRAEMYQAGQKGQNEVKRSATEYLQRMGENGDVEALSTAVSNIVTGQATQADISLVSQNQNAQTAVELLTDSNLEAEEGGIEANLAKVSADRAVTDEIKKVTNGNNIQVKRVNAEAGLVRDEYTQTLDAKEMDKLDAVAKAFGVKVVFKDKVNMGKDDAAIQGSVVEIEKGTDRALEYLIGHEIMHRIRELSPQSFKSFANAVKVSRYSEYAAELETTERVYEEGEDYDEEAICNMAGKIALDSKLLEKFIEQNKHDKGILQALLDVFKKIWNTVTKAEQRKINDAIYQLEKALNEGSKVAERLAKEGKLESRDSIDYEAQKNNTDAGVKSKTKSTKERFDAQLDRWDGKTIGFSFIVGETSKALIEAEVPDKQIRWDASKIQTLLNTHNGMTIETIKQIPNLLENPVVVIDSKQNDNSRIIMGDLYDANEKLVTVVLLLTPTSRKGNKLDLIKVSSAQGRSHIESLFKKEDGSYVKIRFKDEKRIQSWLNVNRLQLPLHSFNLDSNPTVPQSEPVVNSNSMQNNQNNSSPPVKSSRKGGDNFATERKQSKDRQVVFNELAQEQANEIQAKLKEALGENVDLRKQLKEANRRAEHFKSQLHRTPELAPDMKALKARAKEYLADYKGSELDVNVLASRMADWRLEMYDIVLNSESEQERENRWEALREKIGVTCGEILSNSYYRNEEADTDYKIIADYVGPKSGVTIRITEELKAEIEYSFGSYLDFRKRFSKHVKFKLNDGTDVSSVYAELAQNVPEYFNESTTTAPADQLIQICEVLESLHNVYYSAVPNNSTLEVAIDAQADMIIGTLLDAPNAKPTFADKQNARLERVQAEAAKDKNNALKAVIDKKNAEAEKIKEYYQKQREMSRQARETSDLLRKCQINGKKLEALRKRSTRAVRADIDEIIGGYDFKSIGLSKRKIAEYSTARELCAEIMKNNPDVMFSEETDKLFGRLNDYHLSDIKDDIQAVIALNNAIANLLTEIRNNNKLIESEDKRDALIQAKEVENQLKDYQVYAKDTDDVIKTGGKFNAALGYTLDPIRWANLVTNYVDGNPLVTCMTALNDGQRKMLLHQQKAENMFRNFFADKEFMDFLETPIRVTLVDMNTGESKVKTITPGMRISLYMHRQNYQNMMHIEGQGIIVSDMQTRKKWEYTKDSFNSKPISLSRKDVDEICSEMTPKEYAFAAAMRKYFDGLARDEINDVSEKLVGYPKAEVKNYFPINVSDHFVPGIDQSELDRDRTLEAMGPLKEREKGSKVAIVLVDAVTVLQRSIDSTSKYVGLAIPIRNLNKLLGASESWYKPKYEEKDGKIKEVVFQPSKDSVLHKMTGAQREYLKKLLRDLQNPLDREKRVSKLLGNAAKSTLSINISSATVQYSSYATAAAEIGWKSLGKASNFFKRKSNRISREEVNENTPLYWYRSKGFARYDTADIAMNKKKTPSWLDWIQIGELVVTKQLYKACEYYVQDELGIKRYISDDKGNNKENPDFTPAVVEAYTRVIERTQSNYTTMQRSEWLRGSQYLNSVYRYLTQPLQMWGMLVDSVGNFSAKCRQCKINPNESTEKAKNEAGKRLLRTLESIFVTQAVEAALRMLVHFARGNHDKYEDEEGKWTWGTALRGYGYDLIASLFNIIPFGSTVFEFVDAARGGNNFYGLSSVPAELITELLKGCVYLFNSGIDILNPDKRHATVKHLENICAAAWGLPVRNVLNVIQTAGYDITWAATQNKRIADFWNLFWNTDMYYYTDAGNRTAKTEAYDMLLYAHLDKSSKGKEAYKFIRNHMIENGVSEKTIDETLKERLSEYSKFINSKAENSKTAIDAVKDMSYYKALPAKQKEKYENKAEDYYREALRKDYGVKSNTEEWMSNTDKIKDKGFNYYAYWLFLSTASTDGNYSISQEEAEVALDAMSIPRKEKAYIWELKWPKSKDNPYK